MKKVPIALISSLLIFCSFNTSCASNMDKQKNNYSEFMKITPPDVKKSPSTKNYHNEDYVDDYAWLRNKENPEVINYLEKENEYTNKFMKSTESLQKKLFDEMVSRIKETDESVPTKKDNYYYYSRTEKGKQYRIYARKKDNLNSPEEILLDVNKLAEGLDYLQIGAFEISPDHNFLAYSVDIDGSETYTVHFKNLKTGELLSDEIENTYYSSEWSNDNSTYFYTVLDSAKRPYKVFSHKLGTSSDKDTLVFHENDESYYLSVSKTKDDKYITLTSGSQITSEVSYFSADNVNEKPKLISPRKEGIEYFATHKDGFFYILTNENAQNFKIVTAPVSNPSKENWKPFIQHNPDVKIDDIEIFKNYIVLQERENGLKKIKIIYTDLERMPNYITFPEPVYNVNLITNPEYDSDTLRFSYESLTTPDSVFDYNMRKNSRDLLKQQEVKGYNPEEFVSERVWAKSEDGTMVPISLVYKKGMKMDGNNPLYLYAYGSYGANMDPYFSSTRLSILDRGFIFAITHIRGGGDLGRKWYEDGKFLKKKNTFKDFIASAEYLIQNNYTSKDKLTIAGGSAGGLLMGSVTNMRPDLFKAVVADVPFVDVINTMMDPTLPLTVIEYDEWGNPNEKKYFDYMMSYSPYDNVEKKDYPNMLVTAGLNDPRVGYWEPAKFVAKLRDMKTDDNVLLLKTNMGAGHGGSSGRYDYLKELAFEYAFLLKILGIYE